MAERRDHSSLPHNQRIRLKYRDIENDLVEHREQYMKSNSKLLRDKLDACNKLFSRIVDPQGAVCDAQVVNEIADVANSKAQAMKTSFVAFDLGEFAACINEELQKFVDEDAQSDESGEDAQQHGSTGFSKAAWGNFGKYCAQYFNKAPAFSSFFGHLDVEEIAPKVAAKRQKPVTNAGDAKEPEEIKTWEDNEAYSARETKKIYELLLQWYKDNNEQPLEYYRLIVNPHCFGQSVENILFVSCLMKDGYVGIHGPSDFPFVEPILPSVRNEARRQKPNKQWVHSFNMEIWRDVKNKYDITEPFIPTRAVVVRGCVLADSSEEESD